MTSKSINRRARAAAVLAGLGMSLALTASAFAMAPIRIGVPQVEGPIPVTAQSHPYNGAAWQQVPIDLKAHGYLEDEYFLHGKANVYGYNADKSVRIDTPAAPYVNRILVLRPADPKRFNGKVVVEMWNASGAADASFTWANSAEYLLSRGYAFVGITSKPVAVEKLKVFDPKRYATLSWANPVPPAQQACTSDKAGPWEIFPGWSSQANEDGLLWDIVAQTGALIRSDSAQNPFRGYDVKAVFLTGHSQSGGYVGSYARDFQSILQLPNGKPIFDGFLQTGSAGLSMINQCTPVPPYSDPHLRISSAAPLIRIMTMTDFYDYTPLLKPYRLRREDSDAPNDRFRLYEVAGAAHVSPAFTRYNPSTADRLKAGLSARDRAVCLQKTPSDLELGPVFNVALEHLDAWNHGLVPPHAERMQVDQPGVETAKLVLDADGNVKGGVRTPTIDVPKAAYRGKSDQDPANPMQCRSQDHMVPFSAARLKTLYPTHEVYVAKVEASVAELHKARWLTDWDAQQFVAKAKAQPAD